MQHYVCYLDTEGKVIWLSAMSSIDCELREIERGFYFPYARIEVDAINEWQAAVRAFESFRALVNK